LQTLCLNEYYCAYYVYYFVYQLQLTLGVASQEVVVHEFFSNLNFIINVVSASCKCHHDLQDAQEANIAHLIAIDEFEIRK
jgi:chloramphenicol O-acetyltransferase